MRTVGMSLALVSMLACDSTPNKETKAAEVKAEPAPAPAPAPEAKAPMPEAPAGTVAIDGVFVHTCAEAESCPALLQDAGDAHCKGLTLGGLSWRLPTLEELERWKGHAQLSGYDQFHWSGSAWSDDPSQLWIYDPGSAMKTTAKPDRKPFTIRCVAKP